MKTITLTVPAYGWRKAIKIEVPEEVLRRRAAQLEKAAQRARTLVK